MRYADCRHGAFLFLLELPQKKRPDPSFAVLTTLVVYVIITRWQLIIENGKLKVSNQMENVIEMKSFDFAVRIVNLYQYLTDTKKEYVLSKQLLRSGTSIGANVAEAEQAQSRPDFVSKMNIALKETSETKYWIKLLKATDFLSEKGSSSLLADCVELEKLLVSIIKSSKQ